MPTLNWIGNEAFVKHHRKVPLRLLALVPARSRGHDTSTNLTVPGDNLPELNALLPYYVGQVKCIDINPPCNTGNEG